MKEKITELKESIEAATQLELSKGKRNLIIDAWQFAVIAHGEASQEAQNLVSQLHDQANFALQDILLATLDPASRHKALYTGEPDGIMIAGMVAHLVKWGRVTNTLRMDYELDYDQTLSSALVQSLGDMEALQSAEAQIREEISKLGLAATTITSILNSTIQR